MLRRNLVVSYKPIKSSSVILSELNHRLMNLSDTGNSCLNVTNNHVDHYCSWLPYGGQTIRDTEIGMNASVAEALGLHEGTIVSCKVVEELPVLDTVYVTAMNQKDWEMLEATSYRIQNTLLDQTRIVNEGQKLVVWVNKAIHIVIKIDKLSPKFRYGKIDNNTEFVVTPFKENSEKGSVKSPDADKIKPKRPDPEKVQPKKSESNGTNRSTTEGDLNGNRESLYDRLFSKGPKKSNSNQSNGSTRVIDSTTLDNVSMNSSDDESDSSDSEYSEYDGNNQSINSSRRSSFSRKSHAPAAPPTSSTQPKPKPVRLDVQSRLFDALLTELKNQDRKHYQFRAVPRKWTESQMCDIFMTQHNKPETFDPSLAYVLSCESINENDERLTKEYYVSVKPAIETETVPKNIYPSVEINDILMAHLNLQKFNRITLSTKKTVLNFVEKIELIPSRNATVRNPKQIEESFKLLLIKNTRNMPMLINQEQIFKLCEGDVIVSAKIFPESFRYCLVDGEILRENKIFISEQRKDVSTILCNAEDVMKPTEHKEDDSTGGFTANDCLVHLDEFEEIVKDCVENIVVNTCLDERNCMRKANNYLIVGPQTTGKSTICKEILKRLEKPPYNCHIEVFHCAQNKARKTESIQKDLRAILSRCVEKAPAILLLDNLDTLAKTVVEHSHDGDYYNRVSDVIQRLILSYTSQNGISIIATIGSKNNLNNRLYTSRGNHLFQKVYKVPDLQKENRKKVIYELSQNDQIKCQNVNYEKFAILTEGYTIGYLLQFIERAIFYAHRNDNNNPTITNEVLINSLKTTNTYCLQGIVNNIKQEDCDEDDEQSSSANKFAGLDSVVRVFEEVLVWPTKYTEIFDSSPLRNQAGILLYGPPGTGKTYLVSQISRVWNLRMISVKGPELLAKFIGQSEENVRNLFDRARGAKPCVLFFDEFDSIAPRRGHDSTGVTDRVVNQLLTELDGVEALQGVIVIAATSRPDLLDPALLRSGRIDRLVQCSLPDREARLAIFESIAQASSLKLKSDVNFEYFCNDQSDNYTGADIKSILVSANMIAVKECLANDAEDVPEEIFIGQKHLIEAFANTRPSLSYQDAIKYKALYARFTKKEPPSRAFVAQRATLA